MILDVLVSRRRILRVAVAAFAVVALVAWGIVRLLSASDTEAPDDLDDQGFWTVFSLEEAADRAGYAIATPRFVPDGFDKLDAIQIRDLPVLGRTVTQAWVAAGGGAVEFIQEPGLNKLGGGEPFEIAGVPGQRKFYPADPNLERVPMLAFMWRDGDFTYSLTGFLGGSLTEDVILKIAASIAID